MRVMSVESCSSSEGCIDYAPTHVLNPGIYTVRGSVIMSLALCPLLLQVIVQVHLDKTEAAASNV